MGHKVFPSVICINCPAFYVGKRNHVNASIWGERRGNSSQYDKTHSTQED
jgi:hypothetical protein